MSSSTYTGVDVLNAIGVPVKSDKGWQPFPGTCPCCGKKNKLSIYMPTGYLKCQYASCQFNDAPDGVTFVSFVLGLDKKEAFKLLVSGKEWNGEKYQPKDDVVQIEPEEVKQVLTPVEQHNSYEAMMSFLSLSEKDRKSLKDRGLTDEEIDKLGYKTLSLNGFDQEKQLFEYMKRKGCKIAGLPGEWHKTEKMYPHLNMGNMGSIALRCRDLTGLTYGIPLRIPNSLIEKEKHRGNDMPKYMWLSSAKKENGHAIPVRIHYAIERQYDPEKRIVKPVIGDTLYLIEGVLKGDICHVKTGKPFACISGVAQYVSVKRELPAWKKLGVKEIVVCYDMDYISNPGVEKALKKVTAILEKEGFSVRQLKWDSRWKGLDDFLVAHPNLTIK